MPTGRWSTARQDPAYGRADWRRARLECLRRANWRCEIRLTGCQGGASQADHIYGLANDPKHEHLRAACVSCHRIVTSRQANAAKRPDYDDPAPRPVTSW